eukprot:CAMPEP_0170482330 /NCGR_PEP_ID=MMETSP0208-20121228/2393_1 /TAXON_ID=197538 /ORGANISM="Strombidium inclinatum, Strain S3" /LENGTH=402 /DNA_ID=CAMNT_0010755157 /DNA_START=112 /DNA_END=1317 /DNA_ORIENTATION=-
MQEYNDSETPLDIFDSECHDCPGGIIKSRDRLTEDDIIFMINVSEQCKRPGDMLMFLGEYFKEIIFRTEKINDAIQKDKQNVVKQQSDFYVTMDVLNYLGTASKMFIENPRQELRISIALARNPTFSDEGQLLPLEENILSNQVKIINHCCDIFKFIDYFHDRKNVVPLKHLNYQPPQCVINAYLYKMKADYLRFIYECLSGDNGLLNGKEEKESFLKYIKKKDAMEITTDDGDEVDCEICNANYYPDHETGITMPWDKEVFWREEKTLLDFIEHDCFHEYEKAKRCFFEKDMSVKRLKIEPQVNELSHAPFHPLFMSALLNQQVFKRETTFNKLRADELAKRKSDVEVAKKKKALNKEICDYIQKWLDKIEIEGYFTQLQSEDSQAAWNLYEILEKTVSQW